MKDSIVQLNIRMIFYNYLIYLNINNSLLENQLSVLILLKVTQHFGINNIGLHQN